jgi:hypothetical protein
VLLLPVLAVYLFRTFMKDLGCRVPWRFFSTCYLKHSFYKIAGDPINEWLGKLSIIPRRRADKETTSAPTGHKNFPVQIHIHVKQDTTVGLSNSCGQLDLG